MNVMLPPMVENSRVFLQRLGYNEHRYHGATDPNFTKRISGARFPRFHVYLDERPDGLLLKLHIDMQESTAFGSRHHGVENGEVVEKEITAIRAYANALLKEEHKPKETPAEKKGGFFSRLFGK